VIDDEEVMISVNAWRLWLKMEVDSREFGFESLYVCISPLRENGE
jgi:hypothetical protein